MLQNQRDWPGSVLASRLGVSERTVRRDIDRLRELGYPVEAQRGVEGGYRLAPGVSLPPLVLDDEEAVALTIGLQSAVQSGTVIGIEESSLRALAKIAQVMPLRLRRRVESLRSMTVPAAWPGSGGGAGGGARASIRRSSRPSPWPAGSGIVSCSSTPPPIGTPWIDWSTPIVWCCSDPAGTWSPMTVTATTGAPSGSIGSTDHERPASGSIRTICRLRTRPNSCGPESAACQRLTTLRW